MKQIIFYNVIALFAGALLDLVIGDPEWMPHLIRLIGKAIAFCTDKLQGKSPKKEKEELKGGKILVVSMLMVFSGGTALLLYIAYRIHPYCYLILATVISFQMLALKDLKKESMRVYHALEQGISEEERLIDARKQVSRIVGRDTERLDKKGVIKAAVETIAENASDGVFAPAFYMAVLGPIGGILYKTVNTMDSMVGYKNEKFLYFGRTAAKLDDVINFIPSRLAAFYMIGACAILSYSVKDAYRIFKRDRFCHASPNSAQTESVMAGALQIQLAGDAFYFGELYKKKTIGDAKKEITAKDIIRANRLLYVMAILFFITIAVVYTALYAISHK